MRSHWKYTLPAAMLAVSAAIVGLMYLDKPKAKESERKSIAPTVETIEATPKNVRLSVRAQGTALPRTQTTLVAEVRGRVIEISPEFNNGGFFKEGETLAQIDPADYIAALKSAKAEKARAEAALAQEEALAATKLREWKLAGSAGEPPPLALRKPQLAQAKAAIAAAEAALELAERDLERTAIRAPYDCLVAAQLVDLGSYVSAAPPTAIARIFSVDEAEVRLPLSDREMARLDLAFPFLGEPEPEQMPHVTLTASEGGIAGKWLGRIDRIESEIDQRTRLYHVVATVQAPYARSTAADASSLPMQAGMFVEAEIEGRLLENAFLIPRAALRHGDSLILLKDNGSAEKVPVEHFDAGNSRLAIVKGLSAGDRIVLDKVHDFRDGMRLSAAGTADQQQ